jgi:hypothetical protein
MADNEISLVALHSGAVGDPPYTWPELDLWQCYVDKTAGGIAVEINRNGTIPGGEDIAEFVAGLIEEEFSIVDIELEVCDPAYADWVSVAPSSMTVDLRVDPDPEFDVTITVPVGTPEGEHCFEICAFADGVEVARQLVCVEVVGLVDIKPGSCPNPFNPKKKGVMPVAIVGTPDFDPTAMVDPSSVTLEGVLQVKPAEFLDSTQPHVSSDPEDCYDCFNADLIQDPDCPVYDDAGVLIGYGYCGDGIMDLVLYFDAQELAEALVEVEDGDCIGLTLEGVLVSGEAIIGTDNVIIRKKGK